jgi:hypothetical protein
MSFEYATNVTDDLLEQGKEVLDTAVENEYVESGKDIGRVAAKATDQLFDID